MLCAPLRVSRPSGASWCYGPCRTVQFSARLKFFIANIVYHKPWLFNCFGRCRLFKRELSSVDTQIKLRRISFNNHAKNFVAYLNWVTARGWFCSRVRSRDLNARVITWCVNRKLVPGFHEGICEGGLALFPVRNSTRCLFLSCCSGSFRGLRATPLPRQQEKRPNDFVSFSKADGLGKLTSIIRAVAIREKVSQRGALNDAAARICGQLSQRSVFAGRLCGAAGKSCS